MGWIVTDHVRSLPVDGPDSLHLQIEAMKLAFADARRYIADIDHMDVRPEALLDRDYLNRRAKLRFGSKCDLGDDVAGHRLEYVAGAARCPFDLLAANEMTDLAHDAVPPGKRSVYRCFWPLLTNR